MNRLKVKYKIIKHPFPDEEERSVYGSITTTLIDDANHKVILLTDGTYDLLLYFNWFISNSVELLNQKLPNIFPNGNSISEILRKFLNQDFDEEDKLYDKYYDYSLSHSYFNSLKGVSHKNTNFSRSVYIGLNNNSYEISMYAEADEKRKIKYDHWIYEIDLFEFIKMAEVEYNKIISNSQGHNEFCLKKYF
jgi:hypothetical protein